MIDEIVFYKLTNRQVEVVIANYGCTIVSIFTPDKNNVLNPEKLTFDGFHYRTARLNEAVELIYKLGEGFSENENGQTESNFDLSTLVNRIGFEPMTLSLEG